MRQHIRETQKLQARYDPAQFAIIGHCEVPAKEQEKLRALLKDAGVTFPVVSHFKIRLTRGTTPVSVTSNLFGRDGRPMNKEPLSPQKADKVLDKILSGWMVKKPGR